MNSKVEALRQLCRGAGIFDDSQLEQTARAFGIEDVCHFKELLVTVTALLYKRDERICFESALNLDGDSVGLDMRRRKAEEAINRSFRTVLRYQIQASEKVAYAIEVLTKHS